jgi:hypothetical protein
VEVEKQPDRHATRQQSRPHDSVHEVGRPDELSGESVRFREKWAHGDRLILEQKDTNDRVLVADLTIDQRN